MEHVRDEGVVVPAAAETTRRPGDGAVWFAERWFDLALHRAATGAWELTIAYGCVPRWDGERDRPHAATFSCADLHAVHRCLNEYDYRRHVAVDYTPGGRDDQIDATLAYVDRLILDVRLAGRRLLGLPATVAPRPYRR